MQEIWKDIEGYEGLYQVSNTGKVKSLETWDVNKDCYVKREKMLKFDYHRRGYQIVTLTNKKKRKRHQVHRLVAKAFIENPENLPQVNHKDENKQNNHVDNLEWCTNYYNNRYGTRDERVAIKHKKPVVQFDCEMHEVKEYDSIVGAVKQNNYKAAASISECCRGKRKTAYGYVWKYKEA